MHIQINVISPLREAKTVDINPSNTILDLKQAVARLSSESLLANPDKLHIFHRPSNGLPFQLDDHKTLKQYELQPDTTLYVLSDADSSSSKQYISYEEPKNPQIFCVLSVDFSESIRAIIERVYYLTLHPSPRPHLDEVQLTRSDGLPMNDPTHTLYDYGVVPGSIVRGHYEKVNVFWKTAITRRTGSLRVSLDVDTADKLKELIEKDSGIPIAKQRITWDGKELEGEKELVDYGLPEDATVVIRVGG